MTILQELIEFTCNRGPIPSYNKDTNELIFDGDIERYALHFWEENGVWHYGESGSNNKRFTALTTPDYDIALRWLIHKVAGSARHCLRFHPLYIPSLPIKKENIAPGWNYEFIQEEVSRLITPEGQHLPMEMRADPYISVVQLVTFSHLMAYTPEQLLTSYMDPYGRPHLTQYLHEDSALVRMGNPLPTPIPPLEPTQ